MEMLRIYLGEQLLVKYYVIKHLVLLKAQSMMDINLDLLQGFISFLIKGFLLVLLHMHSWQRVPNPLLYYKHLSYTVYPPFFRFFLITVMSCCGVYLWSLCTVVTETPCCVYYARGHRVYSRFDT